MAAVLNLLVNEPEIVQAGALGDVDLLKELIEGNNIDEENKIDIDTTGDADNGTALSQAVAHSQTEAVIYLLDQKADLEVRSTYQNTPNLTPFLIAAKNNDTAMIKLLASRGALVNVVGGDDSEDGGESYQSLDIVEQKTEAENVLIAIDKLLDLVQSGKALAQYPNSLYEQMYACIQAGASVNQRFEEENFNTRSMLHLAINCRNLDSLRALLILGADTEPLDLDKMTPLLYATSLGLVPFIKVLVENHARTHKIVDGSLLPITDVNDHTCLMLASKHLKAAKYLIETCGLSIETENRFSVFMYAAKQGNLNFIKYLCTTCPQKPLVDKQDHKGRTALMNAIRGIDDASLLFPMVKYLIEVAGVNIEISSFNEKTALDIAHDNDVDQNTLDYLKANQQLLDWARNKENENLPSLLAKGSCISVRGMETFENDEGVEIGDAIKGVQPLHFAATYNNKDKAQLLLEHNADPKSKDDNGLTPIDYANSNKHAELLAILLLYPIKLAIKNDKEVDLKSELETIRQFIDQKADISIRVELYYHLGCFLIDELHNPSLAEDCFMKGKSVPISKVDYHSEIERRLAEMSMAGLTSGTNQNLQPLDADMETDQDRQDLNVGQALLHGIRSFYISSKSSKPKNHSDFIKHTTRNFFDLGLNSTAPMDLTSPEGIFQLALDHKQLRRKSIDLTNENERLKQMLEAQRKQFEEQSIEKERSKLPVAEGGNQRSAALAFSVSALSLNATGLLQATSDPDLSQQSKKDSNPSEQMDQDGDSYMSQKK